MLPSSSVFRPSSSPPELRIIPLRQVGTDDIMVMNDDRKCLAALKSSTETRTGDESYGKLSEDQGGFL
jgi:hypothetical protein